MEKLFSIDEVIERKRHEMMNLDDENMLEFIYRDIKNLASGITVDDSDYGVNCDIFKIVGQVEFVYLLYKEILLREPDIEGYKHNLSMLRNGQKNRAEMIELFRNSDEGRRNGIVVNGLDEYLIECKKISKIKNMPIIGRILIYVKNLIFLSQNMKQLLQKQEEFEMHFKKIEKELNYIKAMQSNYSDKQDRQYNELQYRIEHSIRELTDLESEVRVIKRNGF